ncbi:hypothetical protein [Gracilibacillus lacisalsi]|uniref:hypothetical protein n=1 Tax=Gracilibacillus lacisalsi TaxID=393087 RepID=UPI000377AF2A|nr:hypothetical protein [Gracilibacillus lacisalsi]
MITIHVVELLSYIPVWLVIVLGAIYFYRKNEEEMAIWKVAILIFVGMFTFDFHWNIENEWRIPVLPLGVWIVYFFMRKDSERWQRARTFAWWGFLSSYLFILSGLIAILLQSIIYPDDEVQTFLANVENAEVKTIHSSGEYNISLDPETFSEALDTATRKELDFNQWRDEQMNVEQEHTEEFPYLVEGVKAKWGSGYIPVVYVSKDGYHLLISTLEQQYYFETEKRLWE